MTYDPKYLDRLALVYIQKHETLGYKEARKWYNEFLTRELRELVHPRIVKRLKEGMKK